MYRLCLTSVLFVALSACAALPPLPTPIPLSSAPTAAPEPPPTAALITLPSVPPAPTLVPSPTALVMAALTPTPPLPQERITADTVTRLRPLRQVGYGRPERAIFAPDNRLLAILTATGVLYVELPSLRPLRFEPDIEDVAFAPDGSAVATVTGEKTALRQLDSGTLRWEVDGTAPQFSPDGRMIIVDSGEQLVVYDVASRQRLVMLAGNIAAFSPDSSTIAVSDDGSTTLYRLPDGKKLQTFTGESPRFSPAGDFLATASALNSGGNWLQLWQLPGGNAVDPPVSEAVADFRFSADGQTLAYLVQGSMVVTLVTRNLASGSEQRQPFAEQHQPLTLGGADPNVDLTPSWRMIVTRDDVRGIAIHRVTDNEQIFKASHGEISFSPDDELALWLVPNDDLVRLIRLSDGSSIAELYLPSYTHIAFSPDGRLMALGADNVDVSRVGDGAAISQIKADAVTHWWEISADMTGLAFDPTGTQVYVADYYIAGEGGSDLTLWDVASGQQLQAYAAPYNGGGGTWEIDAFSPTTGAIASFDYHSEKVLIQLHDDSQVFLPQLGVAKEDAVMAFSPDGSLLAVEAGSDIIHLARTSDGIDSASFDAGGRVAALAFSPDGSLLGVRLADDTLKVWSSATTGAWVLMTTFSAPFDGPSDFTFSADNQLLLARTPDGIGIYRVADGRLLHTIPVAADDFAIGPASFLIGVVHGGQVTLWGVD